MSIGFLERSRVERNVLKVINGSGGYPALNGLSEKAIIKWASSVSDGAGCDVLRVKNILLEISHRLRSNSDASKHVFAGERLVANSTTEICISELSALVSG